MIIESLFGLSLTIIDEPIIDFKKRDLGGAKGNIIYCLDILNGVVVIYS